MAERKPVLLAVDDDQEVVRAVERDLRNRYARDFTVVASSSGEDALEILTQLSSSGDPVALIVTDQRMPRMTGVELLAQSAGLAPAAKRVLLTAYADTEVAMRAINEIHLDHYLMKPWHPPEEHLYPVLDDLLDDWRAGSAPATATGAETDGDAVNVIGHHFSRESQLVRDLLANNQIGYRWLEVDEEPARRLLAEAGLGTDRLPVVLLPDAEPLVGPDPVEVAARVGLQTEEELALYDLVVVGAGPAGLAAAVYGASEGLRTVVVERLTFGGQAGASSPDRELPRLSLRPLRCGPRASRDCTGTPFPRRAAHGAGGRRHRRRRAPPRRAARGRHRHRVEDGPADAAASPTGGSTRRAPIGSPDGASGTAPRPPATRALLDGQEAFVIGGANSAGQAALHLASGTNVTILYRGDSLRKSMSQYLVDRIEEMTEEITVRVNTRVVETHGEEALESITIDENGSARRSRPRRCSCSSAPSRTRIGSGRIRPARSAASSSPARRCSTYPTNASPGRWNGIRSLWRRASPASSPRATCVTSRSSAWPRRSARARWRCCSSTST